MGSVWKEQRESIFPRKRLFWIGVLLTLLSAVLWGSTYPVIQVALGYYTPFQISFYRAAFASLTLLAYYGFYPKKTRVEILRRPHGYKTWALLVGAAILGAAGFWNLLNLSVKFLQPDTATFLAALYPIIAVALAIVVLKENLTIGRALGILLGIAGSYIILSLGKSASISGSEVQVGVVLALATAFSFAGYILVSRILIGRKYISSSATISPQYVTLMTFLISVLPTFLIALYTGSIRGLVQYSPIGLLLVVYLGVVASGIAFLMFNVGLSIIGPSRAAINQLLFPAISVLLSYYFLQETINLGDGVGIAMILAGIFAAQVVGLKKN